MKVGGRWGFDYKIVNVTFSLEYSQRYVNLDAQREWTGLA